MAEIKFPETFYIKVYKESDKWVAECAEYGIATQGDTVDRAIDSFKRVFYGQLYLDQNEGK